MSRPLQVWSCGGGVQSAAIAALIVQGKLPKPDLAVIVDTLREKSSTWRYLETTLRPALRSVGVEIQRVDSGRFRTVDLFSKNGNSVLLPVFSNQSGQTSKLPAYCSAEWKRDVVARWLRSLGVSQAVQWMGISRDEMSRVRAPRTKWLQVRYPLIFDYPMRRQDCVQLVADMGWPKAPRSSCFMCPNMRNAEWVEMRAENPQDFEHAVEVERQIRQSDPHAFVHESCVPLDQVDFTQYQATLFGEGCAGGACWT